MFSQPHKIWDQTSAKFLGLGNAGDEMLSAASEIIKDRNDLTEKLEQELSESRTGQQMGVAQALQAVMGGDLGGCGAIINEL